ncbi:PIG-L family deacetylase, partial [Nonomuraea sp. NPDC005501]|uniref:PIG-L deacetylase family protein n=1 Tax=Nonomuraea sp. NPDC005501 TaxID=3156884 RepID=UPI0033B38CC7
AADTAAAGMRLRRAEDVRACAALGAEHAHLDFTDALYRRTADGSPRCAVGEDLFSAPGTDDVALEKAVAGELGGWIARLAPVEVHAPAAVGGHLDHVLTARACASALRDAASTPRARWYEDLPYALEPAAEPSEPASAARGRPAVSPLTGEDWRRKIAAAAAYRSQHPMLWDDDWPDRLLAHAREAGGGTPGERHWEAAPGPNGDH